MKCQKAMIKIHEALKFRDHKICKICLYILMGITGLHFLHVYSNMWMNRANDYILFSLIPLFFIISFLKKNDSIFLIAEFITIGGDIALMIFHNENVGFPIYIFVQIAYAAYFYFRDTSDKRKKIIIVIRVGLSLLSICIGEIVLKSDYTFAIACAIIYYLNILINLAYAIIFKDVILIIGFSLFAISDLVIGLKAIVPDETGFRKFLEAYNWIHIFYLPSQAVLIFNKHNNNYLELFKRREEIKNA